MGRPEPAYVVTSPMQPVVAEFLTDQEQGETPRRPERDREQPVLPREGECRPRRRSAARGSDDLTYHGVGRGREPRLSSRSPGGLRLKRMPSAIATVMTVGRTTREDIEPSNGHVARRWQKPDSGSDEGGN